MYVSCDEVDAGGTAVSVRGLQGPYSDETVSYRAVRLRDELDGFFDVLVRRVPYGGVGLLVSDAVVVADGDEGGHTVLSISLSSRRRWRRLRSPRSCSHGAGCMIRLRSRRDWRARIRI